MDTKVQVVIGGEYRGLSKYTHVGREWNDPFPFYYDAGELDGQPLTIARFAYKGFEVISLDPSINAELYALFKAGNREAMDRRMVEILHNELMCRPELLDEMQKKTYQEGVQDGRDGLQREQRWAARDRRNDLTFP